MLTASSGLQSFIFTKYQHSIHPLLYCRGMKGFLLPFLTPAVHIDSRQLDAAHSATVWTLIPASLGYIVRQKIGCAIFSDQEMNPPRFSLWLVQIILLVKEKEEKEPSAFCSRRRKGGGGGGGFTKEAVFISIVAYTRGVCLPHRDPVYRYAMNGWGAQVEKALEVNLRK